MSLDTIAIFDVVTAFAPVDLVSRLAVTPAIVALVPRFGAQWDAKEWRLEGSQAHRGEVDAIGPGGLVLRLGARSLEAYHALSFRSFAADADDRRLVRGAFHAIARAVGSKRAVYTHELAPTDREPHETLDVVIASLTDKIGAPARSFAELAASTDYKPGSWMIDTFADLDVN